MENKGQTLSYATPRTRNDFGILIFWLATMRRVGLAIGALIFTINLGDSFGWNQSIAMGFGAALVAFCVPRVRAS